MKISMPNLDDEMLDPEELSEFGKQLARVSAYAETKAAAMRLRLMGDITLALRYEQRCEMIYALLPQAWRW